MTHIEYSNYANATNLVPATDIFAPIDGVDEITLHLLSREGRRQLEILTVQLECAVIPYNTASRDFYISHRYLCNHVTGFYVARDRAQAPYIKPPQVAQMRAHMERIARLVQTAAAELGLMFEPHTPPPAAPETEEFPDNLPLEPLQADEFRPTPATTRDKRVQSKSELRCYAVARDHGLNPHSAASMRNAFNRFNGTYHASRADFSEDEWRRFARDIEDGVWILEWKQVLFKTRTVAA